MATFDLGIILGVVIGLCAGAFLHLVDCHCFQLNIEMSSKRGIPEKIGKHWYQLIRIDNEE